MNNFYIHDGCGNYIFNQPVNEKILLRLANKISAKRLSRGQTIKSSKDVMLYLNNKLAHYEQEVFAVLFMDNRHRIISFKVMFYGTINGSSVYPREVVKQALKQNSASVILVHNHPSGDPKPSDADQRITKTISDILRVVDIKVLDHIVVGMEGTVSLVEQGLM